MSKLKRELQGLESQEGKLLNHLRNMGPDAAAGWAWVSENQDKFDKEVFGPPMLTCSLKDMRYADLIQAMLGKNDFLCFTTQTREDHMKLSDQLFKVMRISATVRTNFSAYADFEPPVARDQLGDMGLDGYVTDYIEGPEPVLAMLCSERRLHQAAVSLRPLTDAHFDRIEHRGQINSFACGTKMYRITRRREYGPGAVSTRITAVQNGRWWTNEPVDMTEKAELERKLDEFGKEGENLKAEWKRGDQALKEMEREEEFFKAEVVCLPLLTDPSDLGGCLTREY